MARFTEKDVVTARQTLREAIAIDSDLASAFAELGNAYVLSTINGWGGLGAAEASKCAADVARQAIQLDPADAAANAYGFPLVALFLTGDCAGGLEAFDRAVRLSPRDPWKGMWSSGKGIGAFIAERYQDVLDITRGKCSGQP